MKEIEWSEESIDDLATLNREIARRIKTAVERFCNGHWDVKKLQGIEPPEFRLRVGDYRIRFSSYAGTIQVLRVLNPKQAYL